MYIYKQVGRPLELDTDGIWCILPKSFPSDFTFKLIDGGNISISYPCVMLNADVHERYTNHQVYSSIFRYSCIQ
jgi:DNA polymerase epsilon subunit 1